MFNPLSAIMVAEMRARLGSHPTAVDLGNQTFDVSDDNLLQIRKVFQEKAANLEFDFDLFDDLLAIPAQSRGDRTHQYYRAIGYADYSAIDINSKHGSLIMDLNLDLRAHYGYSERFDLVANIGTGEHIFDQAAVFKNMHDITKPNGIMLFVLPFIGYPNHGFYNFHPGLFGDLASANKYRCEHLSIGNRWGFREPLPVDVGFAKTNSETNKKMTGIIQAAIDKGGAHLFVITALRKIMDADFVRPFQGIYSRTIESEEIKQRYAHQIETDR